MASSESFVLGDTSFVQWLRPWKWH